MADYSRMPDVDDVEVTLKSSKYWPVGARDSPNVIYAREQAAIGIRAAVAAVEEVTGYIPFLSTDESAITTEIVISPRQFQGTGIIRLNNGMLRLDGVSINGQALALEQVITMPAEAPMLRRPYTYLYLPFCQHWRIGSSYMPIRTLVTARFGYCTIVPADLWQQALQYACLQTLEQIENAPGLASLSQDGFTKAYDVVGTITPNLLLTTWGKGFKAALEPYTRRI